MNYEEYCSELEVTLKKLRPAGYQIQRMKDHQGEDRLTVQKNGSFELNYRMESLYEDYRCGGSIKAVAKELIQVAEHNVKIRVAKKEEKEAAAFHPKFLYAQEYTTAHFYEELQNYEVIVVTIKDGKVELKFPAKGAKKY